MTEKYWAVCPIEEIADKVKAKFDDYRKWMHTTGYADRMRLCYQRFYAIDKQGSLRVQRNKDDIAIIDVNHYKALLRRSHIMATESKVNYIPKARNSDAKSQVQSDSGRGILEYYGDEKDMNGFLSKGCFGSLVMLEQVLHAPWDYAEGFELTVDGQAPIKTGDQKFEVLSAFNAARCTATNDSPWWILRVRVNKYDEAAKNPKFAAEILASSIERDAYDLEANSNKMAENLYIDDQDYTYKYIAYHRRTPAVEQGRWIEIIAGQVLRFGGLTYPRMPVSKMKAGDMIESVFADSPSVDILGLQEAMNALFSGVVTNGLNNLVQMIFSRDPKLTTRKLDSGQVAVHATEEPKPLNLNGSNAEAVKIIDMLLQHSQLITGINDVARGNPSAHIKTNGAMTLLLAQAIQYIHDIQKSYMRCAGEIGTIVLGNLLKFGPEEMVGYIVGTSKKGQIRKYKKEDILDIERVTADLGNPILGTQSGRYELAMDWSARGVMKDPKQLVTFIRTGDIDTLTDDDFGDNVLIKDENEMIKRGENPPVLLLDMHDEHIMRHKAVMNSPEAREDPILVKAGLAHIREHLRVKAMVPPEMMHLVGMQPPQMLPPGGDPAAAGGRPTVNGMPMPGTPQGTPAPVQENYDEAMAGMPEEESEVAFN